MDHGVEAAVAAVVSSHRRRISDLQAREAAALGRSELIRQLLVVVRQSPEALLVSSPPTTIKAGKDVPDGGLPAGRKRSRTASPAAAAVTLVSSVAVKVEEAPKFAAAAAVELECGDGEVLLGQDDHHYEPEKNSAAAAAPHKPQQQECTPPILREECELLFPTSSNLPKSAHGHSSVFARPLAVKSIAPTTAKSAFLSAFEKEKHPRALRSPSGLQSVSTVRTKEARTFVAIADDGDEDAAADEMKKKSAVETSPGCTPAEFWSVAFPSLPHRPGKADTS